MILAMTRFVNSRYFKLSMIVLSLAILSSIIYMRQTFEATMLTSFNLTSSEFETLYTIFGIVTAITLFLSGWVTDYFSPRLLLSLPMFIIGLTGFWFANFPGYNSQKTIFIIWALATGLLFWPAHIKAVKLIARPKEQGRFFGGLDAGRGFVEAIIATIVAIIFAYIIHKGEDSKAALGSIIYIYAFLCIAISLAVFFLFDKGMAKPERRRISKKGLVADIKAVLSNPLVWLMALIIFCGWQLGWAAFSFSNYLQQSYQSSARDCRCYHGS